MSATNQSSQTNQEGRTAEVTSSNLAELGFDEAAQGRIQQAVARAVEQEVARQEVSGYNVSASLKLELEIKVTVPK
jgi:hypothetical protein